MPHQEKASLTIITGSFGSGKSEYALNLAMQLPPHPLRILVDLDLVNAYFRSREACELLNRQGVKLIAPAHEIAVSDLPISGPGVREMIKQEQNQVIMDIGGDDLGAIPLGGYRQEIMSRTHSLLLVINPYRPFTSTVYDITLMKNTIEATAGLTITGIISNPNLGPGTSLAQIIERHRLVVQAADIMDLPVLELMVLADIYSRHKNDLAKLNVPLRPINLYLPPTWLIGQLKKEATVTCPR